MFACFYLLLWLKDIIQRLTMLAANLANVDNLC